MKRNMAQPMCKRKAESEMEAESSDVQPKISATTDTMTRPPTVVDRYFSKHYRIDLQKKKGEDVRILTHSNKICITTLAPSHPVLAEKKTVTQVNFKVGGANRLTNKMSGKRKRGAQWLGSLAPLCSLICNDNTKYTICAGVKGQLIEANEALVENPQLVTKEPWGTGFLGIMLPGLGDHKREMDHLLTEDQYQQALNARLVTNNVSHVKDHVSDAVTETDGISPVKDPPSDAVTVTDSVSPVKGNVSDAMTVTDSVSLVKDNASVAVTDNCEDMVQDV